MKLIVAVDRKWGIGNKGDLLISIPEDMKFFKEKTTGNTVVMGKNTLLSLPGGKPLKNRNNIVIALERDFNVDGCIMAYSIEEFLEKANDFDKDNIFVIGGGSIYKQLLPYCDTAYITYIDKEFEADTFIPNLDELSDWKIESQSEEKEYDGIKYVYRTYVKK